MAEHPIILSADEVRAIRDGRKTQVRRVVKYNNMLGEPSNWCARAVAQEPDLVRIVGDYRRLCPYGVPGDVLWVKETWAEWTSAKSLGVIVYRADLHARYALADNDGEGDWCGIAEPADMSGADPVTRWLPSIHMPRWASRLTLRIEAVRAERLQDISAEDAVAEGCRGEKVYGHTGYPIGHSPIDEYRDLWDSSSHGKRHPWASNPFVWVREFKREEDRRG